ncbi:hypothetical protein CC2G_001698 [Coprinopsis cinerea AmutBmut pab1-1]|nr:hypothetical protein CC2G_001698 [Coprinopsis cinerea AmutBmut pab1-1]
MGRLAPMILEGAKHGDLSSLQKLVDYVARENYTLSAFGTFLSVFHVKDASKMFETGWELLLDCLHAHVRHYQSKKGSFKEKAIAKLNEELDRIVSWIHRLASYAIENFDDSSLGPALDMSCRNIVELLVLDPTSEQVILFSPAVIEISLKAFTTRRRDRDQLPFFHFDLAKPCAIFLLLA